MQAKVSKHGEYSVEDSQPLVERGQQGAASAASTASPPAGLKHASYAKWISLALLVVQNSSLFVVTRFSRTSRAADGSLYLGTVVVLIVELAKLTFCLL